MRNKFQLVISLLLFFLFNSFAQEKPDSIKSENSFGVIGAPFLSHSPETKWSFGLAGFFYFHLENPNAEAKRLSSIFTDLHYTTKKQFTIKAEYDFYFIKDTYRIYGDVAYSKFPFQFFGTGNNTLKADQENYTPKFTLFELNLIRKILAIGNGKLNAGIRYDFRYDKILTKEENGKLANESIPGNDGGRISGLGASINFDSRDNSFSTTSGEYFDFKFTFYDRFLGSDFIFKRYSLDLRKFFIVNILDTVHVFAVQAFGDFTNGTVPFYLLTTFGGENNLRGIYSGRFRDNNSIFLQAEYRFPVFWRFGIAFFGGIGEVANRIGLFQLEQIKFAGGMGIRFLVIRDENISVRVDFGFSKYNSDFYLSFNEAF